MVPCNSFALQSLPGFMGTASLALIFYVVYLALGRRLMDLLLANLLACGAIVCLGIFLMSNAVPEGAEARKFPDAADFTLAWERVNFIVGWLSIPVSLHFVLRYCRSRNFLTRHIGWLYVLSILCIPTIYSSWFLEKPAEPLVRIAAWLTPPPWFPKTGWLIAVFVVPWLLAQVYIQGLLWRRRADFEKSEGGLATHAGHVRWALLIQASGATVDSLLPLFPSLPMMATVPITSAVMAVLLTIAIVKDRLLEERTRLRQDRELEIAAEVQRGQLPAGVPQIRGFELVGWSKPAHQAGGDLYDYHALANDRWALVVIDASGHGMGAALMAAETRAVLRSICLRTGDPAAALREANDLLVLDLTCGRYVTCFLGFLYPASYCLSYASAGHAPVIFYQHSQDSFELQEATEAPLAVRAAQDFRPAVRECHLAPGDFVAVVSDGFHEAANPAGESFGIPRLLHALRESRDRPAEEIVGRTWEEVSRFMQSREQDDDCTLVFLRRI